MRVGGMVNTEFKLVILPEGLMIHNPILVNEKPYIFGWCGDHFFVHTYEAALNLGVPILFLPTEMWLKVAQSSFHKMVPELITHCETYHYADQLTELQEIMKRYEKVGKTKLQFYTSPNEEGGY